VGLPPPPPEPGAEAIEHDKAVHVGSRTIARQAGGTPGVPPAALPTQVRVRLRMPMRRGAVVDGVASAGRAAGTRRAS
jgi:hypothetical protein